MTMAAQLTDGILEIGTAGPGYACAYCGQPCASDDPAGDGCCSAEHRLLLRIAGDPRMGRDPLQAPDAGEVRRLRSAMAEATSWEQLFRLAQRIWHCPVVDDLPYRTSARAQLHGAYTQAVERLWRRTDTRRRQRRSTGMLEGGDMTARPGTGRPAPLTPGPPPATGSLAGSQVPPPPPVKAERLRRAHGAALTAAAVPAPGPAIGAGGGPPQGATT